jgi:hypothetical protein
MGAANNDKRLLIGGGVLAIAAVAVALSFGSGEDAPPPRSLSVQQLVGPAASSSVGYAKGYEFGLGMGRQGAGSPTDDALRSMSAIHAPDDQLQFRIGYRNGLLAGQQERARK